MQHTTRQSRLISTVLLGSLIALGSTSSFAADGSDHLRLNANASATNKLQRLAEDGSERSRVFWLKHHLDVAEGGADRVFARKA